MASDFFLRIDGLEGESADGSHPGWIEVLSFSHSMVAAETVVSLGGGGGTIGPPRHGSFVVNKAVDSTSPVLYQMCSSGRHVASVTLDLTRATDGSRDSYMTIQMGDVVIASVALAGAAGGDAPADTVAFRYRKIVWTFTGQTEAGGSAEPVTGGWDLGANKATASL